MIIRVLYALLHIEATAAKIAAAIVIAFGGSIAGGAIGVNFTEDVAVEADHYTLTGYDYSNNQYTAPQPGVAKKVITVKSKSYNEWFYEGFVPQNWKDGDNLAYVFWADLYNYLQYPGVKSYS